MAGCWLRSGMDIGPHTCWQGHTGLRAPVHTHRGPLQPRWEWGTRLAWPSWKRGGTCRNHLRQGKQRSREQSSPFTPGTLAGADRGCRPFHAAQDKQGGRKFPRSGAGAWAAAAWGSEAGEASAAHRGARRPAACRRGAGTSAEH